MALNDGKGKKGGKSNPSRRKNALALKSNPKRKSSVKTARQKAADERSRQKAKRKSGGRIWR